MSAYVTTQPGWAEGAVERFGVRIGRITLSSGDIIEPQQAGVTAIVGSNNAGKSTILREVFHWLPRQPNQPGTPRKAVEQVTLEKQGNMADLLAWLGTHNAIAANDQYIGFPRDSRLVTPEEFDYPWVHGKDVLGSLAGFVSFYGDAAGRLSIGGSVEMRDADTDPPTHPVHHLQDSRELRARISTISREVFGHPLTLDSLGRTLRLRVGEVGIQAPPVDDITPTYRKAMSELGALDQQGDGMRGFFGQILPVLTGTYPVIMLDEPEAFLHPPQARSLGRELGSLAVEKGVQILVATHDRNLLTGLLDSGVEVSVVRVERPIRDARASQLRAHDLRQLWNDPVLRYTNILDGLFHKAVVLAEAEGDCAFLAAALDHGAQQATGDSKTDLLFVPTGGKDALPKFAKTLHAVNVPVVVAPDLDIISDMGAVRRLFESLGGRWTADMTSLWTRATEAQRVRKEPAQVSQVLAAVNSAMEDRLQEPFTGEVRDEWIAQTRTRESPWLEVKKHGVAAFTGSCRTALLELLGELESVGIVPVREGELERLAPEVEARKGPGWLAAALVQGAQANEATQAHVDRIRDVAKRLLIRTEASE